MIKKLLCLALALVMLSMTSMAMATSPSADETYFGGPAGDADTQSAGQAALATVWDYLRAGGSVGPLFGVPGSWILAELTQGVSVVKAGTATLFFPSNLLGFAEVKVFLGIVGVSITWIELKVVVKGNAVDVVVTPEAAAAAAGKPIVWAVIAH